MKTPDARTVRATADSFPLAPEIDAELWLNTPQPLSLAGLRGRIVVMEAFQMLCPGCVAQGLPLAQEIQRQFDPEQVAVIGLHSVFEHHEAMTPVALRAFVHEYRLTFPIAVDRADPTHGPIPQTMRAYALQGTPSLAIIDQQGRLRAKHFGHASELLVGATLGNLLAEGRKEKRDVPAARAQADSSVNEAAAACGLDGRCEH